MSVLTVSSTMALEMTLEPVDEEKRMLAHPMSLGVN